MRQNFFLHSAWVLIAVAVPAIGTLYAQENPPAGQRSQFLAFLTPEQREELKTDRKAVFAANPSLQEQAQQLAQEGKTLRDDPNATPEDKKAFREKMKSFRETLEAALVQQDPSVKPILAEIAQHRRQQYQQNGGNSASNAAPQPGEDLAPES